MKTSTERPHAPIRPGKGLLVGVVLLLIAEAWLHTDHFLERFRSVFAAGRAMDKVLYIERKAPTLLIVGNSRADNGFDPKTVKTASRLNLKNDAFNMGIPGADTRVIAGILARFEAKGIFGPEGTKYLILSLDEALVQKIDTLGQEVFFASPSKMLANGQYQDFIRASFRLYGYSQNFRQLREPGTLSRFINAISKDVEPMGGGAHQHLGYRAGFGGLQEGAAASKQEATAVDPPDPANIQHLWEMLDLLKARGVQVAVVFPPLLNRDVLYQALHAPGSQPYQMIAKELRYRHIPMISLDDGTPKQPIEFVNAGHLNNQGAQRYSKNLGNALTEIWGIPTQVAEQGTAP